MIARYPMILVILFTLLMIGCGSSGANSGYGTGASSRPSPPEPTEPSSNVIVNNVHLDYDTLKMLAVQYGITIQEGVYWYDNYSGAWGNINGPTLGFITPDLNIGGRLTADASRGKTGVYLNGRELPFADLDYLEFVLGPIPSGRYWLDSYGNMGVEGYAAEVNIIDIQTASSNTLPTSPYQSQGDDFIMGVGDCTIASDGVIC